MKMKWFKLNRLIIENFWVGQRGSVDFQLNNYLRKQKAVFDHNNNRPIENENFHLFSYQNRRFWPMLEWLNQFLHSLDQRPHDYLVLQDASYYKNRV